MFSQKKIVFNAGLVIAAIAAIWTLIHIILGFATSTANDEWNNGLLVLFVIALVLAFVQFARDRSTLKSTITDEKFPEPAVSRFFTSTTGSSPLWFVVRMYVGAEWLLAGWEKAQSPAWGTSGIALSGFVKGALAKSTGANPAVQGWYASFLQNSVLPHAGLFSVLVNYGEIAVGLGVLVGALTGIAAGFGILMNLNYLLAGTVSINPILGVISLFLVFSWRVCGWLGIDSWLLPALGLPWKAGTLFHKRELSVPSTELPHAPTA